MDDDQFDDLKQYISGVVSQSEKRLTDDLGGRIDGLDTRIGSLEQKFDGLEQRFDQLEQKMDDGFAAIGEAIADIHDVTGNHETRVTKLETQKT